MNQTNTDEPVGYTPRKYNIYESQIVKDWDNVASVLDLLDGWVRTVATETDLKESQVDAIVEKIGAQVMNFRERDFSPFAGVEEIRQIMIEEGLDP